MGEWEISWDGKRSSYKKKMHGRTRYMMGEEEDTRREGLEKGKDSRRA